MKGRRDLWGVERQHQHSHDRICATFWPERGLAMRNYNNRRSVLSRHNHRGDVAEINTVLFSRELPVPACQPHIMNRPVGFLPPARANTYRQHTTTAAISAVPTYRYRRIPAFIAGHHVPAVVFRLWAFSHHHLLRAQRFVRRRNGLTGTNIMPLRFRSLFLPAISC